MRAMTFAALLAPALLALAFLGAAGEPETALLRLPRVQAEEPPAGDDGKDEEGKEGAGNEAGEDLGDQNVSFSEQVNKAIEEGVNWLRANPAWKFNIGDHDVYHWGLVKGTKIYGGGTGPQYRHPAGPTALALYALLKCGVDPDDHEIEKGFAWLREMHTITEQYDGTDGSGFSWTHTQAGSAYEISTMILALTAKYDAYKKTSGSKAAVRAGKLKIKNKEDREWLIELVNGLIERRGNPADNPPANERLGWRYNTPKLSLGGGGGRRGGGGKTWNRNGSVPPHANQDLSSTQLSAMALFSAQRFGVKVPIEVWQDILAFTLDHQEPDGPEYERPTPGFVSERYGGKPKDRVRGFVYIKGSNDGSEGIATGSMTACGIANLLITREMLAQDSKVRKELLDSGKLKEIDQAVFDGLAWLDRNWSSFTNPKSRYGYHIYYLYCVERAMDILGKKLVGTRLWYPEGAKEILKRQNPVAVEMPDKKGRLHSGQGVFWNTNSTHEPHDVLDTCFALLYLKRATQGMGPPVAITGEDGGPKDGR
ncbi:MAG: hypothetical protein O2894_05765 [Planctomycetota bacterium]|nr:hypothetical protein [Planctomycetota bacterium]